MANPNVSVIIPTYNDARYIEETVKSVLQQSYQDFEIVVYDDASTDNTVEVLSSIKSDKIRILIGETNAGAGAARNAALRAARGRYIAFLDSDDVWIHNKLELQLRYMKDNVVQICASNFFILSDSTQKLASNPDLRKTVAKKDLLKYCSIQTSSLIYDRDHLGLFEFPEIRRRQDYAMFLNLLGEDREAHILRDRLFCYRIRVGSISSRKLGNMKYQWSVYRDLQELGLMLSMYYFTNWLIRSSTMNLRRRINLAALRGAHN